MLVVGNEILGLIFRVLLGIIIPKNRFISFNFIQKHRYDWEQWWQHMAHALAPREGRGSFRGPWRCRLQEEGPAARPRGGGGEDGDGRDAKTTAIPL